MSTSVPISQQYLAYYHLRHRNHEQCVTLSGQLLEKNPLDQTMWFVKARALTAQAYVEDESWEQENLADALLEDTAMTGGASARPGTSARPSTSAAGIRPGTSARPGTTSARPGTSMRMGTAMGAGAMGPQQNPSVRPMTNSGRPITGFVRPGTMSQNNRGRTGAVDMSRGFTATMRSGTAVNRPVTGFSGSFVRLNTASLMVENAGGPFLNVDKLDLKKYAAMPLLSRALFEYILYQQNNPRKALELATLAGNHHEGKDWWWNAQVGRCHCWLGMYRDAERQLKKALNDSDMLSVVLDLGKIYIKRDQPKAALDLYGSYLEKFPGSTALMIATARVYEAMFQLEQASGFYKQVLAYDNANVEAISSLAGNCFYSDQPEVALIFYRRLLQMGVESAEIWTNLGMCCFYAQQYDMTLGCFERALLLAEDDCVADIWYNLGHVALGLGDVALAQQCWKVSVASDHHHAESYCNLGVSDMRSKHAPNVELARANFESGIQYAPHMYENYFNAALLAYRCGDHHTSLKQCQLALDIYPEHTESVQLMKRLMQAVLL